MKNIKLLRSLKLRSGYKLPGLATVCMSEYHVQHNVQNFVYSSDKYHFGCAFNEKEYEHTVSFEDKAINFPMNPTNWANFVSSEGIAKNLAATLTLNSTGFSIINLNCLSRCRVSRKLLINLLMTKMYYLITLSNGLIIGVYLTSSNILLCSGLPSGIGDYWMSQLIDGLGQHRAIDSSKYSKLTFGADPEFELYNVTGSKRMYAGGYFRSTGEIGTDGNSDILELRPNFAFDADGFVRNVDQLIQDLLGKCNLSIKGDELPLGGHIHVGGVAHTPEVGELLDDFVGKRFINLSGRARGTYKKLGSMRDQPHGIEYRSLPSCTYYSPQLMYIIIKLIKGILQQALTPEGITYNVPVRTVDLARYLSIEEIRYMFQCIRIIKGRISPASTEPFFINWPMTVKFGLQLLGKWHPGIGKDFVMSYKEKIGRGTHLVSASGEYFSIPVSTYEKPSKESMMILGLVVPEAFAMKEEVYTEFKEPFLQSALNLFATKLKGDLDVCN